jgi:hypothetical protein
MTGRQLASFISTVNYIAGGRKKGVPKLSLVGRANKINHLRIHSPAREAAIRVEWLNSWNGFKKYHALFDKWPVFLPFFISILPRK